MATLFNSHSVRACIYCIYCPHVFRFYQISIQTCVIEMTEIVLPGDRISGAEELARSKKVILGPGLRRENEQVIACKAGRLHHKEPNTYWVDNYQQRYVPIKGEAVIGVVTSKAGDIFRVDIGAHDQASLSYLAFESATKKNRPDVNSGDILYGRLIVASRDLEPELVCVNSSGKKGKLGVLTDGFVMNCSLNLARLILQENCPLLQELTKEMPYEIAVGLNGRIWIKAKSQRETIALGNAILAAENASNEEMSKICENIGNILFS